MDVDSISIPVHCGHHQVALKRNPSAIAKDPILLSSELCSQAKAFEFTVNVHEDGWAHRRTEDQVRYKSRLTTFRIVKHEFERRWIQRAEHELSSIHNDKTCISPSSHSSFNYGHHHRDSKGQRRSKEHARSNRRHLIRLRCSELLNTLLPVVVLGLQLSLTSL